MLMQFVTIWVLYMFMFSSNSYTETEIDTRNADSAHTVKHQLVEVIILRGICKSTDVFLDKDNLCRKLMFNKAMSIC